MAGGIVKRVGACAAVLAMGVMVAVCAETEELNDTASGMGLRLGYQSASGAPNGFLYVSNNISAPFGFDTGDSLEVLRSYSFHLSIQNIGAVVDSIGVFLDYSEIAGVDDPADLAVFEYFLDGISLPSDMSAASESPITQGWRKLSAAPAVEEQRVYLPTQSFYNIYRTSGTFVLAKPASASRIGGVQGAGARLGDVTVTNNGVRFVNSGSEPVTLRLLDIKGREVSLLFDGIAGPGESVIPFSGAASRLPAGRYLVSWQSGNSSSVVSFVVTR